MKSQSETTGHEDVSPTQCVSITFPPRVLATIEEQATQYGVTRQDLIKVWIGERIKSARK